MINSILEYIYNIIHEPKTVCVRACVCVCIIYLIAMATVC